MKQSERERAQRLASSAAGAAMESDARMEAIAAAAATAAASEDVDHFVSGSYAVAATGNGENGTNTFEPGEGKSAEESFATQFTVEEKAKIRDMVANASSAEEIDRIESLVKRGVFPGTAGVDSLPLAPPSPLSGKRTAEGEEGEGSDSKRQRSE